MFADLMWPPLIFLALGLLVVIEFWWHRRRERVRQAQAQREFTAVTLRQHQAAYEQARAEQQALFNSMVEGVLLLDPAGKIQMINRSLARSLNLELEPIGKTIDEAFHWPALTELAIRVARERQVLEVELDFPGLDKPVFQINGALVEGPAGANRGTILVFHEITRLKQLENTRQEFVANVSHELRTPLSLIKGFAETLLDSPKNDPALTTRFLQKISRHADRLAYLIEDLLTISKLESSQTVLNFQPVLLREVATRVAEDLQALAAEKKVTLENLLPDNLMVRGDSDRLQQVIFNLVENAIKYGRSPGRVTLGAALISEQRVEVWVQDDGPGIPPEAQERVFERFYRVDKARSRETGGTGLGLAIVKHIVQAHGGQVRVESELNKGSRFIVMLPCVLPLETTPAQA
ncbi:MAG: ATP-binding protein [Verrucomicrobiota bacterium]|jgi:two-component system, OmpR family, phosphate regulon sensor histidine kinase PhoR